MAGRKIQERDSLIHPDFNFLRNDAETRGFNTKKLKHNFIVDKMSSPARR